MNQRYFLSKRSMKNLEGVDPSLVGLVKYAIRNTNMDFAVIEGVRTLERQKTLFEVGASKTLNSKHLTGHAVDLMAYINGRGCWELPSYDEIARVMREGAIALDIPIRWGGAWTISDIRCWDLPMAEATQLYIDQKHIAGKRPFIDAPHFELMS